MFEYWRMGLAAGVLAIAAGGAASAQGLGGGSFYVKGFGGATIPQDDSFALKDTLGTGAAVGSGLDYDTGYVLGIAGGYDLTPNVALELEYAYRNSDADLKGISGSGGSVESNAFMANALYKFDGIGPNGAFQPYVGAGLGAADMTFDPNHASSFDGDYNFAYQVMTGVAYNLTPNWSLTGEVRYFAISDESRDNGAAKFDSGYETFDALVGATYAF